MKKIAIVLLLLAGLARAEDEQTKLVKVVLEDGAKVQDRENALASATALALRTSPPHPGALADGMKPLLEQLRRRTKDKAYEHFVIAALRTIDVFTPFADLGPLIRPYLAADVPKPIRRQALAAVAYNGAAGVAPELEAMLREPEGQDGDRQKIEQNIVDAAKNTPPAECAKVLGLAFDTSRFRAIQHAAARGLAEKRSAEGKAVLQKALQKEGLGDDVLSEVAKALFQNGSLDGVAELMKKLKKRPSTEVYRTLCEISFHPEGWKGVAPDRFTDAQGSERAAAVAAIQEWWKRASTATPDSLALEAIRAAGISVPVDPNSKELVSALIEALALDPPALRYTALELLNKKADCKEQTKDFNVLKTTAGANTLIYETEPPEGFEDAARRAKIKEQQKDKIEKLRQWWQKASAKATLVDGVWRTS